MRLINYAVGLLLLDHLYKVDSYRLLTHNVAQIFLSPLDPPGFSYEAGQYLQVVHPDQRVSPFSIANTPQASGQLELHLLFMPGNPRAMEVMRQVQENKQLCLRGPFGNCRASRLEVERPVIFLARGTGFAPIKAVIERLLTKPSYPPMHLYWSVAGWNDLYFREQVEQWVKTLENFKFTAVLSREYLPQAKFGKVAPVVLEDHPDLSHYQVYASGPEALVYSALYDFQQHGLAKQSFYSDVFDFR